MAGEEIIVGASALKTRFEGTNLHLTRNVSQFNAYKLDPDDESDAEDHEPKDPAIVAADVAAQTSFLQKLKFQYLELNAKDRYVKSIVSDIDDAPIVTADDNQELMAINEEKKNKLKVSKAGLAEVQKNIRALAPMVEQDYRKIKLAAEKASDLSQKIIDARLALTRLRQLHPQPRLTIPLADQKLMDQVTEMQTLNDEVEAMSKKIQGAKEQVKSGALQVEELRVERAELEKTVKSSRLDEDDERLAPSYERYTIALNLHCSMHGLQRSDSPSENEYRLTYQIPTTSGPRHQITIALVFAPDTRRLAAVHVSPVAGLDLDVAELVDEHIQVNDAHGVVEAILSRAAAARLAR
ncbi:hypothetical protein BD779DRAFT_503691 [Infundibulicybe gibba]|nr:hypothetical protein BD779DRAFT_503691 [Infundibulicybe gibba]